MLRRSSDVATCLAVLLALATAPLFASPVARSQVLVASTPPFAPSSHIPPPVVTTATTFDLAMVTRAVEFAGISYCLNDSLTNWTCALCKQVGPDFQLKSIFFREADYIRGIIGLDHEKKTVVLAFEGTETLSNWITDLEAFQVDLDFPGAPSGVRVHGGFWRAYNSVRKHTTTTVSSLVRQNRGYDLLITGHSLGGALAQLAALDYTAAGLSPIPNLVTAGSPRVGNSQFATWSNETLTRAAWRLTHAHDIVVHLPLEAMGFHHAPWEIYQDTKTFTGQSNLRICDRSGEDPNGADNEMGDSVNDHLHYLGLALGRDNC
eukprot:UC1_evm2s641